MSFKTVFYALQDVFPQVDLRILKAVASKYSSDINSAVEFVLSDVLPAVSESEPTETHYPLPPKFDDVDQVYPNFGVQGEGSSSGNQMSFLPYPSIENYNPFLEDVPSSSYVAQSASSSSSSSVSSTASFMAQTMEKSKYAESSSSQYGSNLYPHKYPSNDNVNPVKYDATEDLIQLEDYSELPYQPLNNYAALNSDSMENSTTEIDQNVIDYTMTDTGYKSCSLYENEESRSVNNEEVTVKVSEEKIPLLLKETLEASAVSEVPKISGEGTCSGVGQQSKSKSQFEAIDELIDHVTKSKEILSSAMKATISKIKEVELQEENAKLSREEAAKADGKLTEMMESIDNMIRTAKDTNNEHARQVEEEKSLLTKEAEELHSRLLHLSSDKEEYESIINEVNSTLHARLVIASEESASAQKVIAEKEEKYLKIRSEKESTLEEIMKESLMLKNEAEGNTMLREFLLEYGHKVDVLQGEISSIKEEVILLKEQTSKYKELNTAVHSTSVADNLAFDIPVTPLAPPCSLVSSTFMEDNESRIFDGATSILRNDYLTIKEHESEKKSPHNQVSETNVENQKVSSDDEDWEIY